MSNLKGWRTVGVGFLIAVGPTALSYLAGVDWTKLVGANAATFIAGAVMVAMRLVTNTPPGQSS